jgi:phosphoglycerol transferase MdoB-like AlkP superfamily enzyme
VKNDKYFANTIFVIHGDHGLPNRGAENMTAGYRRLELNRFHVPLVIYSPLIKTPKRHDVMATEMDVLPTLAGLTGHTFANTGLGRNLFALDPKAPRYAWSYVYYANPLELFVYDQEYIVRGTPDGAQNMYLYNGADSALDVKEKFPEKFKEMSDLLLGFYETGKWMIFHNKP